jgi:hypothetical protein
LVVFPRCSLGPYQFRYGRFARALKNSQLTCGDVTTICETVHYLGFESLMKEWQTLNSSMEALAALGAELRLRQECPSDDSRVRSLLREVVQNMKPGLLDDLDADQQQSALALIQASFRQATELLENPGRAPGWNYQDPAILESQGRTSPKAALPIAWSFAYRESNIWTRTKPLPWHGFPAPSSPRR